jgi:hypothetical protein
MPWSKRDWERHIRTLAKTDRCIRWTEHVKKQMRTRHITFDAAMDVLTKGVIHLEPEPDIKTGDMICRMERFVAGRPLAICAALKEEGATKFFVVTAIVIGG